MTELEASILKTVAYADIFDYPLTAKELWQYLVEKKTTYHAFQSTLTDLVRRKTLILSNDFYSLPSRKKIIALRRERTRHSFEKMQQARRVAKVLAIIPTVYFVGVSGAVAAGNAPKDDDIDFFIITAPYTLWLTRLLVTIILDFLGVRRKPESTNVCNKICMNMFLDGSKLRFEPAEQDLYTAHEIVQLTPMVNKHKLYERFLYANKWLLRFLPHIPISGKFTTELKIIPYWLKLLNAWCENFQLWYMRKRRTSEVIRTHIIKLHPNDARMWVKEKYVLKLHEYKIT